MKNVLSVLLYLSLMLFLAACGLGNKETGQIPADINGANTYSVLVIDENGEPVQGVEVRFGHSDTAQNNDWVTRQTDANGEVSFSQDDGDFSVRILNLPNGYYANELDYKADANTAVEIVVFKNDDEVAAIEAAA